MPLLLHVDKLQPEMCLASNVVNGFSLLLPEGWQLADGDIEVLKNDSPHTYIPVQISAVDKNVEFEDTRLDEKISLEVRNAIGELFTELSNMVLAGTDLDDEYLLCTRRMIAKALMRVQYNPVKTAILCHQTDDNLACHTANVFHLSIVIGTKTSNYIKEERQRSSVAKNLENAGSLAPLATGAFYHDIALISNQSTRCKGSPAAVTDNPVIRTHPSEGADMLAGKISAMARVIIRSHHENWDGSGYPQGIAGDKINVFARILRVADAYCATTAPQAGTKGKSPVAALHEMLHGKNRRFYDPVVLQALASVVQPFPNGAMLKLQTGESLVVVGHNPEDAFKPKVVVAFDKQNKLIPAHCLEPAFFLSERDDLRIVALETGDMIFLDDPDADGTSPEGLENAARTCEETPELV